MSNVHLDLTGVTIDFPTPTGPFRALDNVNLKIAQGEFISLIGHSGCGKSTVLNIVAGLYKATEGGVVLDGKEVDEPGPERAVVFQNHSLLPWLTAYENVELAVKRVFKGKKSRAEMREWIEHNLKLVHMDHAMDKRPDEISGGMKQRVGIARALAMEPTVLLMDEPFGALDALTRAHLQDSLMEIHARLGNTVIMITHDVDEAVLLSDRIVMMTNGPAATIGEVLEVDLLRPRDRLALADDSQYNHYRAEVLRFLHERHAQPDVPVGEDEAAEAMPSRPVIPAVEPTGVIEKRDLTLGFVPLTDCAPLVIAKEKGFFKEKGLNVTLSRESSWSNIRDKVCHGMLDGAQMLSAMPVASMLSGGCQPIVTALSLGLNGNGITVAKWLYAAMKETGVSGIGTPTGSAIALKTVIEQRRARGEKPLSFAVVFPYSSHNYLLRYWMASAGIDPDRDVKLVVVPPPQMVNYLDSGVIAGFCVGEPWNAHAVKSGVGRSISTSYALWNNHPEKVLGVSADWAEKHPDTHIAMIQAVLKACEWIDQRANREEVCDILSNGRYVNAPKDVLAMSMTGTFRFDMEEEPVERPDFNVFHRYSANLPWRSSAIWNLTQMLRWGQIDEPVNFDEIADYVYRPDIYRIAAKGIGMVVPEADRKREGTHSSGWLLQEGDQAFTMGSDAFMDGRIFDSNDPVGYLQGFDLSHPAVDLEQLSQLNDQGSNEPDKQSNVG